MPIDATITEWLHARSSKHLTVELARDLAKESKTEWFITTRGKGEFVIGKFATSNFLPNHFIRSEDGSPLAFQSVEAAQAFLANELKVLSPAIFNFR